MLLSVGLTLFSQMVFLHKIRRFLFVYGTEILPFMIVKKMKNIIHVERERERERVSSL